MAAKPTREKDYEAFKKAFCGTLAELGIYGMWDIRYEMPRDKSDDFMARCNIEFDSRVVRVEFSHCDEHYTVERLAKHEAAHILLADLACLGHTRFATKDEIDRAEERVCNILERVLP